jgi:predicted FMN-binding regulatory protein PaiB
MLTAVLYRPDHQAIDALIAAYTFGLVISASEAITATPLPLLLERDPTGDRLVGHFARANPQLEALPRAPRPIHLPRAARLTTRASWTSMHT